MFVCLSFLETWTCGQLKHSSWWLLEFSVCRSERLQNTVTKSAAVFDIRPKRKSILSSSSFKSPLKKSIVGCEDAGCFCFVQNNKFFAVICDGISFSHRALLHAFWPIAHYISLNGIAFELDFLFFFRSLSMSENKISD